MRALSLLIKPASSGCNMRCRYCFYADIADSRAIPNYGMMTQETLENIVQKTFAAAEETCMFGFQGGEPTLAGLDFFKKLITIENRYNTKNIPVVHTLQTNGLRIDADWAKFLAENKFLVGVSIDPPKQHHDQMRPDAAGKDTHNRVVEATRLLTQHGAEFNVLSVVTKALARHPEKTYRYYRDRGFGHVQFIPCLDSLEDGHGVNPHSLDAATYGKFLCRIFDLWHQDFVNGKYISIRMFDNWVHVLGGRAPENCAAAGVCQPYLLVEGDGSVFPCDFYALDDYRLGNINTDDIPAMLTGEAAKRFALQSHAVAEPCRGCEFFAICRGGCRRDREMPGGGGIGLNVYCDAYKVFFAHALPRMRRLAMELFQPPGM